MGIVVGNNTNPQAKTTIFYPPDRFFNQRQSNINRYKRLYRDNPDLNPFQQQIENTHTTPDTTQDTRQETTPNTTPNTPPNTTPNTTTNMENAKKTFFLERVKRTNFNSKQPPWKPG